MGLAHTVAAQLREPRGLGGRVAGEVMRIVNRRPLALALERLDVRPGQSVLELGFGPGEGLRALARRAAGGAVHGVDASPVMLARASARNARAIAAGTVRPMLGRFEALPLPDGSLDRVLAVNVAYFWDDGAAVMREIGRVLKPGGRLSVFVTDAAAMQRWRFPGPGTHRLFDAASLAGLLSQPPFGAADVEVSAVRLPLGIPGLVGLARRPQAARPSGGATGPATTVGAWS